MAIFLTFLCWPPAVLAWKAFLGVVDCVEQKKRPPLGALILLGMGGLLLVVVILLAVLAGAYNLHLYLLGLGLYRWMFDLCTLMAVCLLFGGLLVAVRRVLSFKTLILGVLLAVWMSMAFLVIAFAYGDVVYTEISSPPSAGKVHELVIEERGRFMIGEGVADEKVSPCFMRRLDSYGIDDGICHMHGLRDFAWYEDGFIIDCHPDEKIKYAS